MPGGVMPRLSDDARRRVAALCRDRCTDALERCFQNYGIALGHVAEPGAAVREKLAAIAEKSVAARVELQTMSEEAHAALWDAIGLADGVAFYDAMIAGLSKLAGAGRSAHNATEVREGRRPSKRQAFVRDLAAALQAHRLEVSARPNGALCQISGILLSELDDCPADVAALVRNAMRENPPEAS